MLLLPGTYPRMTDPRNSLFVGSSIFLIGPSSTLNPFFQNVIVLSVSSGSCCWLFTAGTLGADAEPGSLPRRKPLPANVVSFFLLAACPGSPTTSAPCLKSWGKGLENITQNGRAKPNHWSFTNFFAESNTSWTPILSFLGPLMICPLCSLPPA